MLCRLRAPDDLVEHGEREKEERPAPGQVAPALGGQMQRAVEHDLQHRFVERQAEEQRAREKADRARSA